MDITPELHLLISSGNDNLGWHAAGHDAVAAAMDCGGAIMHGARITLDRERNLWQLWLPNVAGPAYEHSDLSVLERLLDALENQ